MRAVVSAGSSKPASWIRALIPLSSIRRLALALLCSGSATCLAQAAAAGVGSAGPAKPALPAASAAIQAGYAAWRARDAGESRAQAALLPRDHLLKPWAQGWAALADPSARPEDLSKFARKFPPSLMRWRLFEEAAVRRAKAGQPELARAELDEIPVTFLGPLGRCAASLAYAKPLAPEAAQALLTQGSGAGLCSKAAVRGLQGSADAYGAAFFGMSREAALSALTDSSLLADPSAREGLALADALRASEAWDPAAPLTSREAASRRVATALGSGQCPKELPAPDRLNERGQANAARCALWTRSPSFALPYWRALARSAPSEARWELLIATAENRTPSFGGAPTSYTLLAARALHGSSAPAAATPQRTALLPSAKCQDMEATLALALWSHGARREALAAWSSMLARSNDEVRTCLGARAEETRAHALRIAAFAGSRHDPRAYEPAFAAEISAAARASNLDADLLFSLARQESRFDETALSPAGALGLFQLMPPTAAETAARAGLAVPSASDLIDPQINARLGALHLAALSKQFDGDIPWMLCAYNAGAGRCRGWRSKIGRLPPVFRVEAMPYDETRLYVERILAGWSLTGEFNASRSDFLKPASRPSQPPPARKPKRPPSN